MNTISLNFLAREINVSVDLLIKKLASLGIFKKKYDFITASEKKFFLSILNVNVSDGNLNTGNKTFFLKRKTYSTLNISNINGKKKIVRVEIRKNRVYLKNNLNQFTNDTVIKNQIFNVNKNDNSNFDHKIPDINRNRDSTLKKDINSFMNFDVRNKNFKIQNNSVNKEEKMKERNKSINSLHAIKEFKKSSKYYRNEKNKTTNIIKPSLLIKSNKKLKNVDKLENNNLSKSKLNKKNRLYQLKNSFLKKTKEKIDFNKKYIQLQKKKKNYQNNGVFLQQKFQKPIQNINRDITIRNSISIAELAKKMAVKVSEVIKILTKLVPYKNNNQLLTPDIAQLIAEDMGHKVVVFDSNNLEKSLIQECFKSNKNKKIRPPIVTIMGHVDHGKTSLLDYIRSTNIAKQESGGITQHIGAYYVRTQHGEITFLDTPGHSAFTNMRARGAKVTDIVVLVVAVDDGVKPQTIEAIQHAKAAKSPIIVAINKIDKLGADPKNIKNELMKHDLLPEDWGGDNIYVNISAKTGEGIDNLLNAILLQSEILELNASFEGMATGIVIESSLDKSRGPIATILVTEGKLKKGDIVLCGIEYGKIRAILDQNKKMIKSVYPSIPVEILGISGVPVVGDTLIVVKNEKIAKEIVSKRKEKFRIDKLLTQKKINLDNIFESIQEKKFPELNIILKSDVQGSLEAIKDALLKESHKFYTEGVAINIIGSGVGGITETDASLALASNAIILGFNVRADSAARRLISLENIDLRYYSIIYDLLNEVKESIIGKLSPKFKKKIIGYAEVRSIFKSPKLGNIAGCMVTQGIINKNSVIKILRNHIVIYKGELESLRRFKEDVNEIRSNTECGIKIKSSNDIRVGDIIEAYENIQINNKK